MTKWIAAIVLSFSLLGCGTVAPSNEPIPDSLLQECVDPKPLTGLDGKAVVNNYVANGEIWKDCRDMHSALIKAVKK